MDTIVILTKIDKDKNIIVGDFGIEQYIFKNIQSALFHFCIKDYITIIIEKNSNTSSYITIENKHKEIEYYDMSVTKPIFYE